MSFRPVRAPSVLRDLKADYTVHISAKTGQGLEELKDVLAMIIRSRRIYLEQVYGYQDAGIIQKIRKYGQLLTEEYREDGIHVTAYVPAELYRDLIR